MVHRVADQGDLELWVEIVGASFALPGYLELVLCEALSSALDTPACPWRLFLGVLDGEPVGASRLFLRP